MEDTHLKHAKDKGFKPSAVVQCSVTVILLAALALFFSFCYQHHFYWQEQNQLFLLSADYLAEYFGKPSWLACMAGDFMTQFYYYMYAGPIILSLLLVLTAWLAYMSLRTMAGRAAASAVALVALVLLAFSMMDTYSRLSSVLSVAGGTLLFLCCQRAAAYVGNKAIAFLVVAVCEAVSFWLFGLGVLFTAGLFAAWSLARKKHVLPVAASMAVVALCPLAMRGRYNLHFADCITYPYIKAPKMPETAFERTLSVSDSYYFGHNNSVISRVRKMERPNKVETFYYYLANAQRGALADALLTLHDPDLGTLNSIGEKTPILIINMMNDLYYAAGDMTYTERAAMMANVFSPQNRNVRYIKRLAEANLASGDTVAAMKYLRLLSHTMLYREWAAERTPHTMTGRVCADIQEKRKFCNRKDTLRIGDNCRTILMELLDSNPDNTVALDYLLCTDLLLKDIDNFKNDYDRYCMAANKPRLKPVYQQALLVWLAGTDAPEEDWRRYVADASQLSRFKAYNANRGSAAFNDTYWYYFDTRK